MERLEINGGNKLYGDITLCGAKNAALPILTACLLIDGTSVIHNCPDLSDVKNTFDILKSLGCTVRFNNGTAVINSESITCERADIGAMKRMRSSILFLGALLGRLHSGCVILPGGCDIGQRPIDMHLSAFKDLGAEIAEDDGIITACANRLIGEEIKLPFPSVGATENIMIAASLSEGRTTIINAAKEPEIADLADFLNSAGAKIVGAGEYVIKIDGVKSLHGTEHTVIPDRILASTLMSACAVAKGSIVLRNVRISHLSPIIPVYQRLGCKMTAGGDVLMVSAKKRAKSVGRVTANPYPAFPTDSQPLLAAVLATSKGSSEINEGVFSDRFEYATQLKKLGADIRKIDGGICINGVKKLKGAEVNATDLRGGAALAVAALGANGKTVVNNTCYIDRGYEQIEATLSQLGADIKRVCLD